jgi:hypothetical protein
VQSQRDGTLLAVLFAITVSRIDHVVDVLGVERDETETVGEELIRDDGGIGFDLHEIDGHGGNFGKDDTAEGVCEGQVDILELEVDVLSACLEVVLAFERECQRKCSETHICDLYGWTIGLRIHHHRIVIHLAGRFATVRARGGRRMLGSFILRLLFRKD